MTNLRGLPYYVLHGFSRADRQLRGELSTGKYHAKFLPDILENVPRYYKDRIHSSMHNLRRRSATL